MGRRADLPSGARKDGYVLRNQQWLFAEIPVLDENGSKSSRQVSSKSCHSPGDWWVRSVDRKEAGREGSAPKSFIVARPTCSVQRKAVSGRDRYWGGRADSPGSLAQGRLPRDGLGTEESSRFPPQEGRYGTPRVDRRGGGWIGSSRRNPYYRRRWGTAGLPPGAATGPTGGKGWPERMDRSEATSSRLRTGTARSPPRDRLSARRTRQGSRGRRRGVRLTNPRREICTGGV